MRHIVQPVSDERNFKRCVELFFALMVDDIFEARKELIEAGIEIDIEPNKGQSETWQMWIHDPDGNKFEIMQYTDLSLQHQGNVG